MRRRALTHTIDALKKRHWVILVLGLFILIALLERTLSLRANPISAALVESVDAEVKPGPGRPLKLNETPPAQAPCGNDQVLDQLVCVPLMPWSDAPGSH